MKIKLISVLIATLCLNFGIAKDTPTASATNEERLPKKWGSDTRAVYDLLVAQFQNSGADYSGSVDTLVKFAKAQKDNQLYAKAFKALLQTERYADAMDLSSEWQKESDHINRFYVLSLALNNDIDLAFNELEEFLKKKKPSGSKNRDEILRGYLQVLMSHWYKPQITTLLERLNTQYPDSVIVSNGYAQQLRWLGDIEGAVALIDKRRFDNARNIELAKRKSDIYRYSVRLDLAEKVWTDLLTDYPNEPLFRFAYAQFLYDRYEFAGSIEELDKVNSSEIADTVKSLQMMALVQLEKYTDAEAIFDKHFANHEDHERATHILADQLLQKKQYELAKKHLEPLVDFNSDNDSNWALASALHIGHISYAIAKDDDFSEADAWFDKVSKHFHLSDEDKLRESANALDKAGHSKLAYERLSAFLQDNPNHEEIRYNRGLIGAEMQMNAAAIEDLKIIHASSPDDIDVQNALGYTLLNNEDELAKGEKLIKKALFSKPSSPAIIDSMGWTHYRRGEFDQALPYFRYAYGNYLDGEIIGHYILALYHAGKIDIAKRLYQLEIKHPPNVKKINHHVKEILPKLTD